MPSQRHFAGLDGIRALAILGVLFYHMEIPWAEGGFQGVTLMFILSGYLVTSGILSEFDRGHSFNLLKFWGRRIRRIFPQAIALIAGTAALCTLFNHILLTKMRPDIIPALTMSINWTKIFAQASYFAEAGGPSPLTHFWTLAIEAQFYLLWPLCMLIVQKLHVKSSHIKLGLIILIALSALLMGILYVPGLDPTRAYYGSDTRLFNLLAGCLLAYFLPLHKVSSPNYKQPDTHKRLALDLIGMASLVGLVWIMHTSKGYDVSTFRGITQLTTLLGILALAALLSRAPLISKLMSLKPLGYLASRSYALYLWHYPIISLLKRPNATESAPLSQYVIIVLLSFLMAEISYRLVETPFRKPSGFIRALKTLPQRLIRVRLSAVIPLTIVIVALCGIAFVPPVTAVGDKDNTARLSQATLRKATPEGVYDVVLIGDSIPLGAKDELTAQFPNGLIDCAVGRHINQAADTFNQYLEKGVVGDIVIFSVASNGPLSQEWLDTLIAAAGEQRQIYFLNCRIPDAFEDANNQLLAALPSQYSNVKIIDWHALSEGHNDWFWSDATHLRQGSPSIEAYVQMIYDAIGYEEFISTPTTYDHLFIGDDIAIGAADSLAEVFSKGVVDCAANRSSDAIARTIKSYTADGLVTGSIIISVDGQNILQKKDIELLIEAAADHPLYFITARAAAPWAKDNNELVKNMAKKNKNITIIDWYDASKGHDTWFDGDGAHLSKRGIKAYTDLIATSTAVQSETDQKQDQNQ